MIWKPPKRSDELYHAWMKKGEKAEDHKYVVRIEDGVTKAGTPKYKYFYSMAEYKAYKEGTVGSNESSKKPGLLARVADKITGNSYKDKMAKLDIEVNENKASAEKSRKSQKKNETEGKQLLSEIDRNNANASENAYNKAVNERAKVKREYESKTLAGKIDKVKHKIAKALEKYAKEQIDKLDYFNQKNSLNPSVIPGKYKIDKDKVDPNEQEYDNKFTEDKLLENYGESNFLPSDYTVDSMKQRLRYDELKAQNEDFSDFCQRMGQIDETQEGFHPASFDDLKKLDEDVNDEIDMYCVNYDNLWANKSDGDFDYTTEGYPDKYPSYGYTQNCAYCTLAYDMRQRGYDVEASAVSQDTANTFEEIESWYDGGEFTQASSSNPKKIEEEILATNPEGSRGQFCFVQSGGGGHSVVYEVKYGEVWIRDCQSGRKMKLKNYNISQGFDKSFHPCYMRTDNLELTDKSLVGVKNRQDKQR